MNETCNELRQKVTEINDEIDNLTADVIRIQREIDKKDAVPPKREGVSYVCPHCGEQVDVQSDVFVYVTTEARCESCGWNFFESV
jgi:predicted RNA-binding Zn-ribbon protein involved in translation (DUF1610 family)